ncbi:MAG: DUF2752 domain-containing protein [Planctomycetota bacterium]|nr:DUF2752 domain-containing protein [Planctomycetota bacterium]
MKLQVHRVRRWPGWSRQSVIVVGCWLALLVIDHEVGLYTHRPLILCPMKTYTGLPCPACGTTRAVHAACTGHPADAWGLNPLAMIVLPIAGAVLGVRLAFGLSLQLQTSRPERVILWIAGGLALAANWWYLHTHGI